MAFVTNKQGSFTTGVLSAALAATRPISRVILYYRLFEITHHTAKCQW